MKDFIKYTALIFAIGTFAFLITGDVSHALKSGEIPPGSPNWNFEVTVVDQDNNPVPGIMSDPNFTWYFKAGVRDMRSTDADNNPDANIHGFSVTPSQTFVSLKSYSFPEGYEFESLKYSGITEEECLFSAGSSVVFDSTQSLPYGVDREDFGCGIRAEFKVFKGVVVEVRSNESGIPFSVCRAIQCNSYTTTNDPVQKFYFPTPSSNYNYTVATLVPEGDTSIYEAFDSADGRGVSYPPNSFTMENLGPTDKLIVSLNRYQIEPKVNLEAFIDGESPESISAEGGSNSDSVTAPAGSKITLVWNSIGANSCDPSWSTEPEAASGKTTLIVPSENTTYEITCSQ